MTARSVNLNSTLTSAGSTPCSRNHSARSPSACLTSCRRTLEEGEVGGGPGDHFVGLLLGQVALAPDRHLQRLLAQIGLRVEAGVEVLRPGIILCRRYRGLHLLKPRSLRLDVRPDVLHHDRL